MKTTIVARNGQLDNLTARLNNGYHRYYSGTKPTDADTALAGNTLLAELRFGATAFGAASAAVATANAITQDSAADASGTISFCRCLQSDGTTAVIDLTVGTSGMDVTVPSTTCVAGLPFQCSAMTITQPNGS